MKRLYFVAETLESTEKLVKSLVALSDLSWQYHVLSKDENGLIERRIRSANFLHKTDVIRQAEQGALIGLTLGVIGAGFYAAFNPQLLPLPLSSWLAYILVPMLVVGWIGGILGIRMQHYQLKRLNDELEYGGYVVMLDVPNERVQMVHQYLISRIKGLRQLATERTIPIPFLSQ